MFHILQSIKTSLETRNTVQLNIINDNFKQNKSDDKLF